MHMRPIQPACLSDGPSLDSDQTGRIGCDINSDEFVHSFDVDCLHGWIDGILKPAMVYDSTFFILSYFI